jgi:hypothetical protein
MASIDKAYILRLYALHDRIAMEVAALGYGLREGDELMEPVTRLDQLIGEAEMIFAEVLTDAERGIPTDGEFREMVDELAGKDGE